MNEWMNEGRKKESKKKEREGEIKLGGRKKERKKER